MFNQFLTVFRQIPQKNIRFFFVIVFSFLIIGGLGCSREPNPYSELLKNDYYAYLLPENTLKENGWELKPIDEDWDAHCFGGPSAPWNPLHIVYQDQEDETQLSLNISDRFVVWDRRLPTEEIHLDSPWAKEGKGVVYDGDDFSPIKFLDIFSNEIVVDGWLSTAEKVKLINQLEYIGPSAEELVNPWSVEWCDHH